RTLALVALGGPAVAREGRVQLEEVVVREVVVKAHLPRAGGRVGLHRPDVPLAEVPADVARLAQDVGDGDLLGPEGPAGGERAAAVGVPAGQYAGPRGRAAGVGGVEAIQAEPAGRHFVQHRRLQVRVAVVAGLLPAVV